MELAPKLKRLALKRSLLARVVEAIIFRGRFRKWF